MTAYPIHRDRRATSAHPPLFNTPTTSQWLAERQTRKSFWQRITGK